MCVSGKGACFGFYLLQHRANIGEQSMWLSFKCMVCVDSDIVEDEVLNFTTEWQ